MDDQDVVELIEKLEAERQRRLDDLAAVIAVMLAKKAPEDRG